MAKRSDKWQTSIKWLCDQHPIYHNKQPITNGIWYKSLFDCVSFLFHFRHLSFHPMPAPPAPPPISSSVCVEMSMWACHEEPQINTTKCFVWKLKKKTNSETNEKSCGVSALVLRLHSIRPTNFSAKLREQNLPNWNKTKKNIDFPHANK